MSEAINPQTLTLPSPIGMSEGAEGAQTSSDYDGRGRRVEIWRDIPDYYGIYQASNEGRIRRIMVDGTPVKILKQFGHPRGYYQVTLSKGGEKKKMLVHRLVAAAWLGESEEDCAVVNHKDGIKRHNGWENLEWVTQGANVEHYRRMRAQAEFLRNARAHQNDPIEF